MVTARQQIILESVLANFRSAYHPRRLSLTESAIFATGLAQALEHIGYCAQFMPIFKQTRHAQSGELLNESLVHCTANCGRVTWDVSGRHARERFLEKLPVHNAKNGVIDSYHVKLFACSNVEAISKLCKTSGLEFSTKLASRVSSEIITLYFKEVFQTPQKNSLLIVKNCLSPSKQKKYENSL